MCGAQARQGQWGHAEGKRRVREASWSQELRQGVLPYPLLPQHHARPEQHA